MRYSNLRAWTRSLALILTVAVAAGTITGASSAPAAQQGKAAAAERANLRGTGPQFGGTIFERPGESYREAYKRVTRAYGGSIGAVRMFFPRMPQSWSSITQKVDNTPIVASFKAGPRSVLAGHHDAELRKWFSDAPTNRRTFWNYWHEPEDDSVHRASYRQAWRHINRLAVRASNPKLKATLILMCWTLSPNSGRKWRHYYPGHRVIDVMGFDCYNTGRKQGVYRDPAKILRPVVRVARSLGKPWGIAEFGSTIVRSDGGRPGRAAWLRRYARYVRNHGGAFATYFDSHVGFDYRLRDGASRRAWRAVVQAR